MRKVHELPGVDGVALGVLTPWREGGQFGPGLQFTGEGYARGTAEEDPRGQFRIITSGFFAALGVPLVAGRDFNDSDRKGSEPVAIISQSIARRMFPTQEALNRHVTWTDPAIQFIGMKPAPMRVIGVAADIDDEHLVPRPTLTVYTPFGQGPLFGGRLFVHVRSDPYALITPITRTIRNLSVDQPVERASTLEDVRAEVLTPDRLNALVFGGFAVVALAIAVVGVGGVLAFSRERANTGIWHTARHRFAASPLAGTCDRGGHDPHRGGNWGGAGGRPRAATCGERVVRVREHAGSVGHRRRGGSVIGRSGRGVRLARAAGRTRRCYSGSSGGLVSRSQLCLTRTTGRYPSFSEMTLVIGLAHNVPESNRTWLAGPPVSNCSGAR